ncbi:XIAP-associated factor 1 [Ursus arctos]|uniref:XIAP-associated factor 1 n=1 Tax=Ursus arctos TaxID=9644 RepID=UPI0020182504|nr:XIAP-associated factor 1 [Ursus arctos]
MASAHLSDREAQRGLSQSRARGQGARPQARMEEWWQDGRQQATEQQERPAEHEFCELAVRLNQLEVHGHRCGGRTGLRPDHSQPVRRQVLAQHREVCEGEPAQRRTGKKFPAPKSRIYCLYCNQMIPQKQFFHHMDKCCSVPEPVKRFPTGKPRTPPAPLPTPTTSDQTCYTKDIRPKMNNRHRFPPPSENSTKQAACGTNPTLTLPLKPEHKRRGPSAARHEAAYDVLRRCSLCGILLPLPILNQHQERCWWLASRKGNHTRNSS